MRYIDDDLRGDLEAVIDVLLPFGDWLTTKQYKPPDPGLPWRNGSRLDAASLQIVPLIDAFIAATSDADLLNRFAEVAETPLAYSPFDDVVAWRHGRGLDAEAEFGVAESQNMLLDAMGNATTRAVLYKRFLPFFRGAMAAYHRITPPPPFADFVEALATDKSQFWPDSSPSSSFIKQLMKDALFTVLDLRGPRPEPWNSAIAIELGEHRRPGNHYKPAEAKKAVDDFKAAMKTINPKATPATSSTPPAVGSPPLTTKPEHR